MNPKCFQAIVDYLNDMKMSSNDSAPDPPSVMDEYANILLSQCKLFGITNSAIEGIGISAIEGSNILNETYCKMLHSWLREDGSDGKFELLYQSSRDGLSADNFHSKCDGEGSTITIIKTTKVPSLGLVLGGYSRSPWTSQGTPSTSNGGLFGSSSHTVAQWSSSDRAFLFVLDSASGCNPTKLKLKNKFDNKAICNSPTRGPTFGSGGGNRVGTAPSFGSTPTHDFEVNETFLHLDTGGSYEAFTSSISNGIENAIKIRIDSMEVYRVNERNIFLEPSESETSTINIPETSSFAKGINDALNSKISALKDAEKEVIRLEMKLEDHDNFISTFASGDTKDVIPLNVSGTAMATKRSTLRVFEESVLARQFDDSTWTDQNDPKVKEWTPDEVFKWAETIEGIPDNVASLFKDNDITGRELLTLGMDGLKMLGIERTGTVCLLLHEIKQLEKNSRGISLFEHSPYCFGKIIDYHRLKNLHAQHLSDEPQLPTVRDFEKNRFDKTVHYFFPGDSSSLILGSCDASPVVDTSQSSEFIIPAFGQAPTNRDSIWGS